jgi:hypothetical protein
MSADTLLIFPSGLFIVLYTRYLRSV